MPKHRRALRQLEPPGDHARAASSPTRRTSTRPSATRRTSSRSTSRAPAQPFTERRPATTAGRRSRWSATTRTSTSSTRTPSRTSRTTTRCSAGGRRRTVLTRFFRDFLLAQQPDIVHFQHTIFLGYDILRVITQHAAGRADRLHAARVRADLPPRRPDGAHEERGALPGGVAAALPRVLPADQRRRRSTCASASSSPTCRWSTASSRRASTSRDRYVDWGIPAEQDRGRAAGHGAGHRPACPSEAGDRPATASPSSASSTAYKGADVLLEAMEIARRRLRRPPVDLRRQPRDAADRSSGSGSASCSSRRAATSRSPAPTSARDLAQADGAGSTGSWCPRSGGRPARWSSMEAFQYGRPVICSDIGGMSEKVTDGVNGLHFRRRDADDLAEVMRRAAETPGLWDELQARHPVRAVPQDGRPRPRARRLYRRAARRPHGRGPAGKTLRGACECLTPATAARLASSCLLVAGDVGRR